MNRAQEVSLALESRGIDGILVSDRKNIRYLSGFHGSSGFLLITRKEQIFFTDFRYEEQAYKEVAGFDIVVEKNEFPKAIIEKIKASGIESLGFESTVSYAFYRSLLRKDFRLKSVTNFIEDMRKIKNRIELKFIKMAVDRAEKAFMAVKPFIRKGASERGLSARLEENLKKEECKTVPFDIIVASGKNSAMPHAQPTDNRIKAGDLVVIDWGGEAGGYFSDMTRTFLMHGNDISKKIVMYETVHEANKKAIDSISDGVHAKAVDKSARDVIKTAGFGDFFGHGTGHGVGLDIHELPRVSRFGREYIKAGMVFTIEPGIYVHGLGGVRIEDMAIAMKEGCKVLTSLPKELEIIH